MIKNKRQKKDFDIDKLTANDTLFEADLNNGVITYPQKSKKMQINMRLEPELVEINKADSGFKTF